MKTEAIVNRFIPIFLAVVFCMGLIGCTSSYPDAEQVRENFEGYIKGGVHSYKYRNAKMITPDNLRCVDDPNSSDVVCDFKFVFVQTSEVIEILDRVMLDGNAKVQFHYKAGWRIRKVLSAKGRDLSG